jgi:hypothetical protein
MAKELTDEEIREMAKKLKKTDKIFELAGDNDADELEDEELEEVSGGFKSKRGYTKGRKIFCPNCGTKKKKNIDYRGEYAGGTDLFYCNKCGTMFAGDEVGHIYETYM